MKSIFKIFFSLFILGAISVPVVATVGDAVKTTVKTQFLYLIMGLDDAADNTDAILMVSYDSADNTAAVVQMPRDTYCNFGDRLNKINHLYSSYRLAELSKKDAMRNTADFIGNQLGIEFDGYFAITTQLFKDFIDSIGGVEITLPEEFHYVSNNANYSFSLKKGKNILDGRKSEIFVRYRNGYSLGDLGRIDIQKIFINGLYNTVSHRVDYDELLKAAAVVGKGAVTDFSVTEFLIMMLKHSSKFRDVEISYVTMPGAAIEDASGIWYYILNKNKSEEVLTKFLFGKSGEFDKEHKFSDIQKTGFEGIYKSDKIKYKVYKSGNIADINIQKKN